MKILYGNIIRAKRFALIFFNKRGDIMTKKRYRSFLYMLLAVSVIFTIAYYVSYVRNNIPDDIYVEPYSTEQIKIDIPFVGTMNAFDENGSVAVSSVNLMDYVEINSAHQMNYTMQVKLFGLINIKEVNVTVKEPESFTALIEKLRKGND